MKKILNLNNNRLWDFLFIFFIILEYILDYFLENSIYFKLYLFFSLCVYFNFAFAKYQSKLADYVKKDSEERKINSFSKEVDLKRILFLIFRIFLYSALIAFPVLN